MKRAGEAPDFPALAHPDGEGFATATTRELLDTVVELAAGLVTLGIGPGERVALHSGTRVEFTYLDYAVWAAGAAATTIYESSFIDLLSEENRMLMFLPLDRWGVGVLIGPRFRNVLHRDCFSSALPMWRTRSPPRRIERRQLLVVVSRRSDVGAGRVG